MTPKVLLTVGISGSGKSTFAKEYVKNNPCFVELNRDDMRLAIFFGGDRSQYHKYEFNRVNEGIVTAAINAAAEWAISRFRGVIISDTNLNPKVRNHWARFAEAHEVPYEEISFPVHLDTCLERNEARDITIPEHVIHQQNAKFLEYMKER